MKKYLFDLLICPRCLPGEYLFVADIERERDGDIETGSLNCPHCGARFPIVEGVALSLRRKSIALSSSLNLVDKGPSPIRHLTEMNRVTRDTKAQFVLSDPFSWYTEAATVEEWLGGKGEGPFAGKGLANVMALLADDRGELVPTWQLDEPGSVWWKIRTHSNHFELIRSCFVHASR